MNNYKNQTMICFPGWLSVAVALVLGSFSNGPAHAQSTYTPYTFSTLAGYSGYGNADGTGSAARFYLPNGVAVDSAGNVYVADASNCTIRKVTAGGVVTTLAGLAESYGSADGTGSAAQFVYPTGVAEDSAGNVYVADNNNSTIRKVTAGGVVTTLAGLAGSSGSADGTGSAARFYEPSGVAVDSAGNVYVADGGNNTIRKGIVVRPLLNIMYLGNQAIISWPSTFTGWTLQTNVNLATPTWGNYLGPIVNNTITNGVPPNALYYRLAQ
jgi:sugar lactone lactonase YvrE